LNFILRNNIDRILRYVLGIALLILSLRLLFNSGTIEKFNIFEQADYIRLILGISEVVASLLFIINRTQRWGVISLLLVFAAYIHLNIGRIPYALAPWTLGILFVVFFERKRKATINTV
jgi:hypothetical protein